MKSPPVRNAPKPSRILLVDDNQHGIAARRSVLQELGYQVIPANSANEALSHAEQEKFDLVITDYKMPKMDGLALIYELRQRGFQKPIILLTGFADTLGLRESNTGADAVIQKSANEIAHLVRSTKRLLERYKQPRALKKPAASQLSRKSTHWKNAVSES